MKIEQYTVENLDFKVRRKGTGSKVVLIHGFGGGPNDWHEVGKSLSANYEVIIPDLTPFYTTHEPVSYSRQVRILVNLLEQALGQNTKAHVVGSSYGGTLSFGLRFKASHLFASHIMFNPMPFEPVKSLRHWDLKLILLLSRVPGVLWGFAKTPIGVRTFKSLGQLFHMGIRGRERLRVFNRRKLRLIENALERFIWIDQVEDWKEWSKVFIDDQVFTAIFYSEKDQLFSKATYSQIVKQFAACQVVTLMGKQHLVVRTDHLEVAEHISHQIAPLSAC